MAALCIVGQGTLLHSLASAELLFDTSDLDHS